MTRAELLTLFERYLKRNDLTDMYSDFLLMAEARLNTVLRLTEMEKRSTSTPTDGFWSLPTDLLELRHIQATASSTAYPLEYVTPEQADEKRRLLSGNYKFYTLLANSIEIIPHPTADSTSEVEIFYYAKLSALTDSEDTNDIVTNYPNLYLYALLAEAATYREAITQAEGYLQLFNGYVDDLNTRAQAARFSGNSMQMRAV
ncbi:MAG: hypothetical protein HKN06_05130 [Gammaproteobacteria bacterium]|nr:hypothetical protein [Gammaproteobacteria bacterium]